jgi:hypothetical protein
MEQRKMQMLNLVRKPMNRCEIGYVDSHCHGSDRSKGLRMKIEDGRIGC